MPGLPALGPHSLILPLLGLSNKPRHGAYPMTDTDRRIQVSVTLPEPLYLRWRKRLDDLNLSRMLEQELERRLKEVR